MTTFIQFALLGLGAAAAYTLLAQGMVMVYLGSGVINFAQGAFALSGAFTFYELHQVHGVDTVLSIIAAVVITALLGAIVFLVVMRPLRHASVVTRAVATLGVLILIQGLAVLIWGTDPKSVPSVLTRHSFDWGGVTVGADRLILFGIALVLSLALWVGSRHTAVGLALRASAEKPLAASALGWSPNAMGVLTWSIGGALAALAGVLIAPLTSIDVTGMPLLVIPVLAAALVGSLSSFPLTLVAATAIGIVQSEMAQYVDVTGFSQAVPFVVIIVFLVVKGRGIPARAVVMEKLPELGTGRVRPVPLLLAVVVTGVLVSQVFPVELIDALTVTFAWATILLSCVVLLGYTGQLSLAQYTVGAAAALVTGQLVVHLQLTFLLAGLLAVLITIPVGLLFALPALRTRGMDLAVVTLGITVAISAMIFANGRWTGGIIGLATGPRTVFGLNVDPILEPARYCLLVLVCLVIGGLATANLRRSVVGQRMVAVRTNERAAAALGVNIFSAKLYAFGVAAALAAVGGILLAFKDTTLTLSNFDPLQSVLAVAFLVVGGSGFVFGSVLGATLISGAFGAWLLTALFPGANSAWLNIIGGLSVLVFLVFNQNGMVSENIRVGKAIGRALGRRLPQRRPRPAAVPVAVTGDRARVKAQTLVVDGVTVRFGGVVAVDDVSLTVRPGEVVGLIGPNGAGKTTMIDVITGFAPAAGGAVRLDDRDVTKLRAHRRQGLGLSRSFQSLELFETSTVRENVTTGCEKVSWRSYVTALVAPRRARLTPVAAAAVEEFGLVDVLDRPVTELSYGQRRLVAIARALASEPSVLLLDEPAAGLSGTEVGELAAAVRRLRDEWGMAVLLIEHDMGFVMDVCDSLTVLDFGKRIAQGPPEVVRADAAVVAAYLGAEEHEPVSAAATADVRVEIAGGVA